MEMYALMDSIVSGSVIDRVPNDFSLEIEKGSILSVWELELGFIWACDVCKINDEKTQAI